MWHTPSMRNHIVLASLFLAVCVSSCKKDEKTEPEKTSETKPADTKSGTETDKQPATPVEPATPEPKPETTTTAEATIAAASDSKVEGSVTFTMKGDSVSVHAKLSGLEPGDHGFHVHEKGDCSAPDAKSAGGHFNPHTVDHGGPEGDVHHAGDLGNITANEEGVAELTVDLPTSFLSLAPDADNNIVGRAVVVHGGVDDLKSQPSGAAGPRIGCGVIEIQKPE